MSTPTTPTVPVPSSSPTKRPRVLVDCDGVVGDFPGAVCKDLSELTGRPWLTEDITEYDLWRGVEEPAKSASIARILTPGWCKEIRPYPQALDGVRKLARVAQIVWVTSPWSSPTWVSERIEWLRSHFGEVGRPVCVTSPAWVKSCIAGDVLVEDQSKTLLDWVSANPNGVGVLWRQPYNERDKVAHPRIVRSDDWDEIGQLATWAYELGPLSAISNIGR